MIPSNHISSLDNFKSILGTNIQIKIMIGCIMDKLYNSHKMVLTSVQTTTAAISIATLYKPKLQKPLRSVAATVF